MPEANLVEKASNARARHEAIEELPPGQRDAIRMLKLEERSLKEASTASGMSIAELKVVTHRAMKNLRKFIERRGASHEDNFQSDRLHGRGREARAPPRPIIGPSRLL